MPLARGGGAAAAAAAASSKAHVVVSVRGRDFLQAHERVEQLVVGDQNLRRTQAKPVGLNLRVPEPSPASSSSAARCCLLAAVAVDVCFGRRRFPSHQCVQLQAVHFRRKLLGLPHQSLARGGLGLILSLLLFLLFLLQPLLLVLFLLLLGGTVALVVTLVVRHELLVVVQQTPRAWVFKHSCCLAVVGATAVVVVPESLLHGSVKVVGVKVPFEH
mmetsp:Transcript_18594/g.36782  ORF Transcript_18594/g.36782 Transcript_18594/m.36782 type:complete len:216 (-) Transcript_18594:708-1355(-)